MTMMTYAFLQHRHKDEVEKKNQRAAASTKSAGLGHAIVKLIILPRQPRALS